MMSTPDGPTLQDLSQSLEGLITIWNMKPPYRGPREEDHGPVRTLYAFSPFTDAGWWRAHVLPTSVGWRRHPTCQDADYFGLWVNHAWKAHATFSEGDLTLTVCADQETFDEQWAKTRAFHEELAT